MRYKPSDFDLFLVNRVAESIGSEHRTIRHIESIDAFRYEYHVSLSGIYVDMEIEEYWCDMLVSEVSLSFELIEGKPVYQDYLSTVWTK